MITDLIVFGSFAVASFRWLFPWPPSLQAVGAVLALLLIAASGLWFSTTGRLSRVWGIVAFVVGWFWMPGVVLAALLVLGRRRRRGRARGKVNRERAAAARNGSEANRGATDLSSDARGLLREMLTLRLIDDWGAKVAHVQVPFRSDYGEGVIPIVVADDDGERGVYVEVAPWTWPVQEACLRWLGLLRTSDHEDLPVEIQSNAEVPELVRFYSGSSLRASFELEGLLCMRWGSEGFARDNAVTLRRLAEKHLGTRFGESPEALATLDELVLEYFRRDQHILPSTVVLLGSLVGEIVATRFGGAWVVRGDDVEQAVVAIPTQRGEIEVNVFGKVMKLFRNGAEDATATLIAGLET